uniref:hypothetical protein n=1 Tax=Roseiarcus sp. TaxID=1969460 RepID=UPI003F95E947
VMYFISVVIYSIVVFTYFLLYKIDVSVLVIILMILCIGLPAAFDRPYDVRRPTFLKTRADRNSCELAALIGQYVLKTVNGAAM